MDPEDRDMIRRFIALSAPHRPIGIDRRAKPPFRTLTNTYSHICKAFDVVSHINLIPE